MSMPMVVPPVRTLSTSRRMSMPMVVPPVRTLSTSQVDAYRPRGLHPRAPVKQRQSLGTALPPAARAAASSPCRLPLDASRLEQFLDFQRTLLTEGSDVAAVATRVVQGLAHLLPAHAVALGLVAD